METEGVSSGEFKTKFNPYFLSMLAFALLNLADIISTKMVLENGGVEYNPFAQNIVEDDLSMFFYKTLGVTITLIVLNKLNKVIDDKQYSQAILNLVNVAYILVIANNMRFFL